MKISIFYSYLLVCLVYVNVGSALPDTLNVTDSSPGPINDDKITGDEGPKIEKNEGTKLNVLGPDGAGDEMESPPPSYKPGEDIPSVWETRQTRQHFSRKERRGVFRPSLMLRERDYGGMSPRSFSRARRFGYGRKYPRRFSRYASYGRRYDRDPYMTENNYEPYPQQFQGQTFSNYQQPQEFSPPSQFPLSGAQQPYFQPQESLAPTQSYRDPYTGMQSQQPQQFATAPQYFPGSQQVNVRPQLDPSSSYYINRPRPQWENRGQPTGWEMQSADPFSQQFRTPNQPANERVEGGSQTMTLPTSIQGNRYQPTTGLELPPISGSLNQFGTSSRQPSAARQRDGARSRTMGAAATTIGENRDRLSGYDIPRTPGSSDQFRTTAQATDPRDESGSPRRRKNHENGDQPIRSEEFQRTSGSNDQLRSSSQSTAQRVGPQPAVETASVPASETNVGQSNDQRPLSGLFSFFRSPSSPAAATTTTESNLPQTRPVEGLGSQQTQAATVAA